VRGIGDRETNPTVLDMRRRPGDVGFGRVDPEYLGGLAAGGDDAAQRPGAAPHVEPPSISGQV
jgi:hypothetical protein